MTTKNNYINRKKEVLEDIRSSKNCFGFPNLEEELRDDIDIVKAALAKNDYTIKFASTRIKENKKIILQLLKINKLIYPHLEDIHKDDFSIALEITNLHNNKTVGIIEILSNSSDRIQKILEGVTTYESCQFILKKCIEMEGNGFKIKEGDFNKQLEAYNLINELDLEEVSKTPSTRKKL